MGSECADVVDGELVRASARLAELAGCRVHLMRTGPANGGGAVDTMTVRWWDGVTTTGMRELLTDFEPLRPASRSIPLCYEHRLTSWGRAVGALRWLDEDPRRAGLHEAVVAQMAAEQIAYPDHGAPLWQQRASGLLSLGPRERQFTLTALRLLLQCARADGWDGAQQWLDSLAGGTRACLRLVR
ncbi:hypothetical protein [Nocardia asteroides]|uniref:hypothetical protein n=1 Tax=Nocardia asteroides TaxID=1824 RepID=UPI001E2960E5|nr:hypothetical protein [Nocardia asteroides]UGT63068.1 hypothetical protein LTT61_07000 [Nocardia asteroides]